MTPILRYFAYDIPTAGGRFGVVSALSNEVMETFATFAEARVRAGELNARISDAIYPDDPDNAAIGARINKGVLEVQTEVGGAWHTRSADTT